MWQSLSLKIIGLLGCLDNTNTPQTAPRFCVGEFNGDESQFCVVEVKYGGLIVSFHIRRVV